MESVTLFDIGAVFTAMINLSVLFLATVRRLQKDGQHFQRIRHIRQRKIGLSRKA